MPDRYRRRNPAEIEARLLLKQQGWDVARSYGTDAPPDLFAMRKGEFLLLMVRHSRRPVPDAVAVTLLYGEDLDRMRLFGNTDCIRSECWVLAPPDGWKCYEVLPGGIRRIWREGVAPASEDALEPAVVYGETCENGRFSQQGRTVEGGESCEDGRVLAMEGEVDQISLPWSVQPRQETSFGRQEIKGYDCSADVEQVPGGVRRKEPEQAPDSPLFPAGRLQQDSPETGLILPGIFSSTTVEISQNDSPKKEGAVNLGPEPNPGLPQRVNVPGTVPETPIPSQVTGYA